jgi:hypothetical protein
MTAALCTIALCIAATAAGGGPDECQRAAKGYSQAVADVQEAERIYARCIAASRAHDDCSAEFGELEAVHFDFERAVSDYRTACR